MTEFAVYSAEILQINKENLERILLFYKMVCLIEKAVSVVKLCK